MVNFGKCAPLLKLHFHCKCVRCSLEQQKRTQAIRVNNVFFPLTSLNNDIQGKRKIIILTIPKHSVGRNGEFNFLFIALQHVLPLVNQFIRNSPFVLFLHIDPQEFFSVFSN